MPELNKQESWEEEFDKLVDSVSQSTDFDNAVYKETREYIKSFIRSQRQLARKELLEELKKRMPEEALDGIGGWNQPFANGFNSYRSDVLEIINQLKEE